MLATTVKQELSSQQQSLLKLNTCTIKKTAINSNFYLLDVNNQCTLESTSHVIMFCVLDVKQDNMDVYDYYFACTVIHTSEVP